MDQTPNDNLFVRLLYGTLKGFVLGVVATVISDWIGLGEKNFAGNFIFIVPICIITGFHQAVFRMHVPKPLVWATITCLGTILSFWFSAFQYESTLHFQVIFYVQTSTSIFITSWLAHKFTAFRPPNEVWNFNPAKTLFCSISGFSSIFSLIYLTCALINLVRNIPS